MEDGKVHETQFAEWQHLLIGPLGQTFLMIGRGCLILDVKQFTLLILLLGDFVKLFFNMKACEKCHFTRYKLFIYQVHRI